MPPIPKPLHSNVKFVCDANEERIYCFTLLFKCPLYNVNMIDLREGSSKWRRLPYLPIKEGQILFSCCYSTQKSAYVTFTRTSIEPHAFWTWTLTQKNDGERQWQCQPVTGSYFRTLRHFCAKKIPPFYLQIEREIPRRGGNPVSIKRLYERCDEYISTPDTI